MPYFTCSFVCLFFLASDLILLYLYCFPVLVAHSSDWNCTLILYFAVNTFTSKGGKPLCILYQPYEGKLILNALQ